MNITQLTTAQLEELAGNYLAEHYSEYNPDATALDGPSYGELANAAEIVRYETLMQEYADTVFSNDDFFCTAGQPEQPERSRRYFYAIYYPQGIDRPSARDILYRYDTAKHRAEDVERHTDTMEPVLSKWARKRFPQAFARDAIVWRTWSDGDRHMTAPWWRDYEDGTQEWTGKPRNVIRERYIIRQVDAYIYDDDEWVYNQTFNIGTFTTAGDPSCAFRRALRRLGVVFIHPHQTTTVYDGDVYEIQDRRTGEPLFAAIPEAM